MLALRERPMGHQHRLKAKSTYFAFAALSAMTLCGCESSSSLPTITRYQIVKLDDGSWAAWTRTHYSVDVSNQRVIRETAGYVARYEHCVVKDVENWECREDNGEWIFGFYDGTFKEISPSSAGREGERHVSAIRWWTVGVISQIASFF